MIYSKPLMAAAAAAFLFAASADVSAAQWNIFGTRGEQAPPAAASNNATLAQLGDGDRVARIEASMRNLTGQIEELTHQLRQLQDQMARLQEDTDFRLRDLEGSGGGGGRTLAQTGGAGQPLRGAAGGGAEVAVALPPAEPSSAAVMDAPAIGAQPLDLSTLATGDGTIGLSSAQLPVPSAGGQPGGMPPPLLPAAGGQQPQVAALTPTGNPRADYDQAYALIRTGQYDLAEQSFRQFLATYPGDELAPEAQYWLGESFFARGDYGSAAEEFKKGYKDYPKSKRGPDTLLKLGLSMAGLDFRNEACKMYALALKQYPDMSNGLRQRVKNEQASASC